MPLLLNALLTVFSAEDGCQSKVVSLFIKQLLIHSTFFQERSDWGFFEGLGFKIHVATARGAPTMDSN